MLINTERVRSFAELYADSTSFQVLLCIDGCGLLMDGGNLKLPFFKGDCIFIPAASNRLCLHGCTQLLRVRC